MQADFDKKVKSIYQAEKGQVYHDSKHSVVNDQAFHLIALSRTSKIQPYINFKDKVLEYGVGPGWNLSELKCKEKVGFDVADVVATQAYREGIKFISDLKQLPRNHFNKIICHHTLEHVPDPPAILQEIQELLAPEGQLLLFVPFEQHVNYDQNDPNHHLYSWDVQSLGNLVRVVGFHIIEARIGRFGYERFTANLCTRFGLGLASFKLIRWLISLARPVHEVIIVGSLMQNATQEK